MYRIKSELIWNGAVVFNWIWIESEYIRVNPQLIWKFEARNASDIVYLLYRWCGKHIVIVKLIFIVYCYKATEISPPLNHTHLNHQTETINILLLITQKNQLLQYIDTKSNLLVLYHEIYLYMRNKFHVCSYYMECILPECTYERR